MECIKLHEGLASARKKYVDTKRIESSVFNYLTNADPTPTKKYLDWICKVFYSWVADPTYRGRNWEGENLNDIVHKVHSMLTDFHTLVKKGKITNTNIDLYETPEEVEEAIEEAKSRRSRSEIDGAAKKGTKKVYESEHILVLLLFSHDASKYYGKGTKWCTSSTEPDEWNRYVLEEGYALYVLINKHTNYKVAALVDKDLAEAEYYDEKDKIWPTWTIHAKFFNEMTDNEWTSVVKSLAFFTEDEAKIVMGYAIPDIMTNTLKEIFRWNRFTLREVFGLELEESEKLHALRNDRNLDGMAKETWDYLKKHHEKEVYESVWDLSVRIGFDDGVLGQVAIENDYLVDWIKEAWKALGYI